MDKWNLIESTCCEINYLSKELLQSQKDIIDEKQTAIAKE
jgi:hypothetical protein